MSSHATYIILSYLFGAMVLGWTAFSPLLKKRRILIQLELLHKGVG